MEHTKFIFLDIDGVLAFARDERTYSDGLYGFDSTAMNHLEKVLEEDPEAKIVLSSSWRNHYDDAAEIRSAFQMRGFKYPERIIGKTPRFKPSPDLHMQMSIPRGCEVRQWLWDNTWKDMPKGMTYMEDVAWKKEHPIYYAIIDDDGDFLLWQKDHFIQTNGQHGLKAKHVKQVLKALTLPVASV